MIPKYNYIDMNAIDFCRPTFKYRLTKARHRKALKRRLRRMYGMHGAELAYYLLCK